MFLRNVAFNTKTTYLKIPETVAFAVMYGLGNVKVKESRNRPGVAQRVREGLGSQIFMTFGT